MTPIPIATVPRQTFGSQAVGGLECAILLLSAGQSGVDWLMTPMQGLQLGCNWGDF